MSTHRSTVHWSRTTPDFDYATYSRAHDTTLESGVALPMSAAKEFSGDPTRANPEELLVAALSSCHMLTFLAIAAKKRLVVDRYDDEAEGVLEKNAEGVLAVTRVVLRPKVTFAGEAPTAEVVAGLHAAAHRGCFIANSVKTEVTIEG